jgi:hypothetical protein
VAFTIYGCLAYVCTMIVGHGIEAESTLESALCVCPCAFYMLFSRLTRLLSGFCATDYGIMDPVHCNLKRRRGVENMRMTIS